MTLWFQNSQGVEREIAKVESWADVWKEIDKFIAECNAHKPRHEKPFKSYYSRIWNENDYAIIDVGSHTEFFKTDLKYEGFSDDS